MRLLIAIFCLTGSFQCALSQSSIVLPYNPDANADSVIGSPDLLEFLPLFGEEFVPSEVMVDGQTLTDYINVLEAAAAEAGASDTVAIPLLPGTEPGEMLYWDGDQWSLLPVGQAGDGLILEGGIPTWRAQRIGCTDMEACNFDIEATVLDPGACEYEDECGVCGGPGAIEECGCGPIPDGDCDCAGNELDALNVCGGTCLADVDGDGICDDDGNDACIGEYDVCGICNGPGAVYECGCTGIAPDECNCQGTPDVDQDGICDDVDPCVGLEDSDGDGICDDVDDCDGTYDSCGVCNGPGPIYDCGCSDIPEGDCDCAGNQPDIDGNCQDYAADTDGDGLYDTLLEPCLNQSTYHFSGHDYALVTIGDQCWFQENLRTAHYANGDSIPFVSDEAEWNEINTGAYSYYDLDSEMAEVYGFLYNWETTADERKVCPSGWTVGSSLDWSQLSSSAYDAAPDEYTDDEAWDLRGGALKEAGILHWESPNFGANNLTGFTALPGGERGFGTSGFSGLGTKAQFWTTLEQNGGARSFRLNHDNAEVNYQTIGKSRGLSIRCVRKTPSFGCTNSDYLEFDPEANVDDGSCAIPSFYGCMDAGFAEYDPLANVDDGSCQTLVGCGEFDVVTYGGVDYEVVGIGQQCWFRNNLRTLVYSDGTSILHASDPVEWANLNSGAYCAYNNNDSLAQTVGYLYNGCAVASMALCPTGWHVPLDEEWQELEAFLGMPTPQLGAIGARGVDEGVGAALKSSTEDEPSWDGNNISGFSALPSGYRSMGGGFSAIQDWPHFWSWQLPDPDDPFFICSWYNGFYARDLYTGNDGVGRSSGNGGAGYSVRCLRSNLGCMDPEACNFEAGANEDDGTCVFETDYYDCLGNCLSDTDGDGVCDEFEIAGCDDSTACNYAPAATDNDDSCTYVDGFCETCEDGVIVENDADADGICDGEDDCLGTLDALGVCNGDCEADADADGICDNVDDCVGNLDAIGVCNGNCPADMDGDGVCDNAEIPGCMDETACNYSNFATDDDGSCVIPETGFDCSGNCLCGFILDEVGNCVEFTTLCDEVELTINPSLSGGEFEVWELDLVGCLNSVSISVNFDPPPNADSYVSDLAFVLVAPDGNSVGVAGYNVSTTSIGFPLDYVASYPSNWGYATPGLFSTVLSFDGSIQGSGLWSLVLLNSYNGSPVVDYGVTVQLTGLCYE